jgi:hypothetical protein
MNRYNPVPKTNEANREEMIRRHQAEAIKYYRKYTEIQDKIYEMEEEAKTRGVYERSFLTDPMNFDYKDACGLRRVYIDVATLNANMAIMLRA